MLYNFYKYTLAHNNTILHHWPMRQILLDSKGSDTILFKHVYSDNIITLCRPYRSYGTIIYLFQLHALQYKR